MMEAETQTADRLAILEQIARYSYAWDDRDLEAYVALFAEGAAFVVDPELPGGPSVDAHGHEAIRAWARERMDARAPGVQVRHHQSGTLFEELDGDRARTLVPEDLLEQEGETVKAVGFLLPLSTSGDRQFLMETSPHCPFCLPITRESLIELTSDEPIGFLLRAVVVEGLFDIADETVEGSLYRMTNVELLDE